MSPCRPRAAPCCAALQGVAAAIASATADPKIQMAGLGNVLFARNSNPQLEYPGKHESPGQMALWLAPDPTQMPIVPENDLTLGTGAHAACVGWWQGDGRAQPVQLRSRAGARREAASRASCCSPGRPSSARLPP